jgi:hypothetical protein
MTNSICEQGSLQVRSQNLYLERFRVFGLHLPDDTIANIEPTLKFETRRLPPKTRRLPPKDEESRTHSDKEPSEQSGREEEQRRALDKLRASFARMFEGDVLHELRAPSQVPELSDRLAKLRYSLETDPAIAASTVVDGITDPTTDHPWRRLLVIAAEGIHFTDDQDRQLIPALMQFIENFRDSNDPEDRIAVCSAIRSYVGLAGAAQVDSVANLLEPGHRASLTSDMLLETVKMVARKFAANPPESPNPYPALSGQVEQVARAYLNPYVLPQNKHAAVAMNAVQALAALASPELVAVIAEVNTCCPAWFRQQLQRRLTKLQEEWETKRGDGVAADQPTKVVREAFDLLQTDSIALD